MASEDVRLTCVVRTRDVMARRVMVPLALARLGGWAVVIISIHLPFILYAFYDCLYQNQTAASQGLNNIPTEIGCMSNLIELELSE